MITSMTRRHYRDAENLVISVFAGKVDDAELEAHVEGLITEGRLKPGFRELADCRGITSQDQVTTEGLRRTARLEAVSRLPEGGPLALVAPSGSTYGVARMYSVFAEKTRREIAVFTEIEEACGWLGTSVNRVRAALVESQGPAIREAPRSPRP